MDLYPQEIQMLYSAYYIVVLIPMSFLLMFILRIRFENFYDEYGCLLWTIFIIQALSLLIMPTIVTLSFLKDPSNIQKYDFE